MCGLMELGLSPWSRPALARLPDRPPCDLPTYRTAQLGAISGPKSPPLLFRLAKPVQPQAPPRPLDGVPPPRVWVPRHPSSHWKLPRNPQVPVPVLKAL